MDDKNVNKKYRRIKGKMDEKVVTKPPAVKKLSVDYRKYCVMDQVGKYYDSLYTPTMRDITGIRKGNLIVPRFRNIRKQNGRRENKYPYNRRVPHYNYSSRRRFRRSYPVYNRNSYPVSYRSPSPSSYFPPDEPVMMLTPSPSPAPTFCSDYETDSISNLSLMHYRSNFTNARYNAQIPNSFQFDPADVNLNILVSNPPQPLNYASFEYGINSSIRMPPQYLNYAPANFRMNSFTPVPTQFMNYGPSSYTMNLPIPCQSPNYAPNNFELNPVMPNYVARGPFPNPSFPTSSSAQNFHMNSTNRFSRRTHRRSSENF